MMIAPGKERNERSNGYYHVYTLYHALLRLSIDKNKTCSEKNKTCSENGAGFVFMKDIPSTNDLIKINGWGKRNEVNYDVIYNSLYYEIYFSYYSISIYMVFTIDIC